MQPMGRKPIKFPSKTDCHPQKGQVNWWESEVCTESKKTERTNGKKEIDKTIIEENIKLNK